MAIKGVKLRAALDGVEIPLDPKEIEEKIRQAKEFIASALVNDKDDKARQGNIDQAITALSGLREYIPPRFKSDLDHYRSLAIEIGFPGMKFIDQGGHFADLLHCQKGVLKGHSYKVDNFTPRLRELVTKLIGEGTKVDSDEFVIQVSGWLCDKLSPEQARPEEKLAHGVVHIAQKMQDSLMYGSVYKKGARIRQIRRNPQDDEALRGLRSRSGYGTDDKCNYDALFELGKALNIREDYEESLKVFDFLIEKHLEAKGEHYVWANLEKARSLHALRRFGESVASCREELKVNDDACVVYYLGKNYLHLGDFKEAEKHAREVISRSGRDKEIEGWAHNLLGKTLFRHGESGVLTSKADFSEAMAAHTRALELLPDEPGVNADLGDCYMELKEYAKAEELLERGIRLGDATLWTYHSLGTAYLAQGHAEKALDTFVEALILDRNDISEQLAIEAYRKLEGKESSRLPRGEALRGVFHHYYGRSDETINTGLEESEIEYMPQYLESIAGTQEGEVVRRSLLRADALADEVVGDQWRELDCAGSVALRLAWMSKKDAGKKVNLAKRAIKFYNEALDRGETCLNKDKFHWTLLNMGAAYGEIGHKKFGDWLYGISCDILDKDIKGWRARTKVPEEFLAEAVALKKKDTDTAFGMFSTITQVDPNHVDSHVNMAMLYRDTKQTHLAVEYFGRALKLRPTHGFSADNLQKLEGGAKKLYDIARGLDNDAKYVEPKIFLYERALDTNNKLSKELESTIRNALGWNYWRGDQNEEAKAAFEGALELNPNNAQAKRNLAWVTYRIDQSKAGEAIPIMNSAIELMGSEKAYSRWNNDIAEMYATVGKPDEARHYHNIVLERKDDPGQVERAEKGLKALGAG